MIGAFGVGLVITVLAALLPALRAARIPPIAAMQDVATPDRPLTKVTVGGALVTAIGATLLFLGLGGHAGDSTLATILGGVLFSFIGVALLTPLISRPVVAALGSVFSGWVPGKLGRLNSGRNPRRTAITAAALMVGIALVTGITVILDSAKSSISGLAQDSISAELVIAGAQSGPRPPTFDPAVLDEAKAIPGVRLVDGEYGDMALVGGERTWVGASSEPSALVEMFGLTATAGDIGRLGPGQMLISSDAAESRGLSVGSTVPVQLARGDERSYTVTGIYESTPLFGGVTLPAEAARDFSIPQPIQGYIQLESGVRAADVLPRVEALLADSPEVSVADRDAFIEQQAGQLDGLLQMIQILLALAIVIAVLGIVNTLALSVLERTRELGLLRAIGLRRSQTMGMITVEAVVISVFGALLGVVVGAGLGAAVVEALRDEGITRLVLPWGQMGVFLGLAAIIGVVAAALPASGPPGSQRAGRHRARLTGEAGPRCDATRVAPGPARSARGGGWTQQPASSSRSASSRLSSWCTPSVGASGTSAGTASTAAPAATALATPVAESSIATHLSMGTPSSRAAVRYGSGCGLVASTSSPQTTTSKLSRPRVSRAISTRARPLEVTRAVGIRAWRTAPSSASAPGRHRNPVRNSSRIRALIHSALVRGSRCGCPRSSCRIRIESAMPVPMIARRRRRTGAAVLLRQFGQSDVPQPLAVDQGAVHVEEHGGWTGAVHRILLGLG